MATEKQIHDLVLEARSYLNVPWKHQGRTRAGVDCVGFLLNAFKSIGIVLLEIRGYSRKPDGIALKAIMDKQPALITLRPDEKLIDGDVVLLKIKKDPQHVCLVTDVGMIHSYNGGEKKVVEHIFADFWKRKIVCAYRLR